MQSHVYGPVPSRRLGRSLGVDPVPLKACTYDCVYCQLGRTTLKTVERREWVPLGDLLDEIREHLATKPDYITVSGSGEPTLYSRLGDLIEGIRRLTSTPIAVLTNGSLLSEASVREGLLGADLVVPSLDAGDPHYFRLVNRPHDALGFDLMVDGLKRFRASYSGQLWLEVLLLGGVTGIESEAKKIAALTRSIRPDRVQLNTVTRPPCESFALAVPGESLTRLARLFGRGEVIAEGSKATAAAERTAPPVRELLGLLTRRPCTLEDVVCSLGLRLDEALSSLQGLERSARIERVSQGARGYYRLSTRSTPESTVPSSIPASVSS